ncbi:MAG: hypothetical protein HYR94_25485 [Chloroflexi bacterium]|nr:hypothetical protein [Chloroflexota bacterium]
MSQIDSLNPQTLNVIRLGGLIAGGVGLILGIAGAFLSPEQFWQSYLLAYIFWLQFPLGCLALVMLHHLVGGRWGFVIRRFLETGAMTLLLMAVLFVPLLFGLSTLYIWTDPDTVAQSPLLQHKSVYLNIPFFLARTVLYFVVWIGLAYGLNRWSLQQDRTAEPALTARLRRLSAMGMILYFLTATFAAYDWLMSLEPAWYSSIYGVLFMVGQVLAALAFAVIGLNWLSKCRPLAELVSRSEFNDLGNFMLGFVMIWAYISFSQFLIIWSANIPEEAVWYVHRSQGGWQWVGVLLILFQFVLPFLVLLSRRAKRQAWLLSILAMLIIGMRLVDLFWLIVPAFHPSGLHFHWLDVVLPIGMGGLWLAVFTRQLAGKPLLPRHDPRLQEMLAHE